MSTTDMTLTALENTDAADPEFEVLQNIYAQQDHVRQRDLAKIAGLSLGMTNAIVKRLVQKGWLTIRKVNNRNIRYAVSAAGIEEITRRSYRYFKRTIRNIVYYRVAIEAFVGEVRTLGCARLVLVGRSDLDFIVEHACVTHGVTYVRGDIDLDAERKAESGLFVLYAESYVPDEEEKRARPLTSFLREVLGGARVQSPRLPFVRTP
jgi:DNA-binding MarR family transcriptional regulator